MRRPEISTPLPDSAPLREVRSPARSPGVGLRPQIVLLGGFLLGGGGGIAARILMPADPLVAAALTWFVRPIEQIFLGALFFLIAPLLVSAIVSGVVRLREGSAMPDLLARTLVYMLAVSASAALIGVAMADLFRPGEGIPIDVGRQLLSMRVPHIAIGLRSLLLNLRSFNGMMLAVIIISFLVAATIPALRRGKGKGAWLVAVCDRGFAAGMKVLSIVMLFAPLAVGCFMFDMMAMFGWHLLLYLSAYILVVLAALALQIVVTFFIVVWIRGDLSPSQFLKAVQEAALIAFCTSSSNATLPTALKVAESDLRLPERIARPILGVGTVANQSGTTIYITVSSLFIGQFFGMDTPLDRQALVLIIATLAGMGTVGVPAGSLPTLATVLALTGLPPEGIGLVMGVDRLLDMFRTLVNVVGDLAIAVAISHEPLAREQMRS